MSKYIELVKGLFTANHEARAKHSDPYVAYSKEANRLMLNLIPEPADGPADNEIWYTSSNGDVVTPSDSFGVSIVSNKYNNGKGVMTFGGPVTNIGDYAFYGCSSLTSVTIPNSVTSIGSCAFDGCSILYSIIIPNSVTRIGDNAFSSCYPLYSITIPNSVTSIGNYAFDGCSSLTSITFEGTIDQWNAISKGWSWNGGVAATYVQCSDGQVTL